MKTDNYLTYISVLLNLWLSVWPIFLCHSTCDWVVDLYICVMQPVIECSTYISVSLNLRLSVWPICLCHSSSDWVFDLCFFVTQPVIECRLCMKTDNYLACVYSASQQCGTPNTSLLRNVPAFSGETFQDCTGIDVHVFLCLEAFLLSFGNHSRIVQV